MPEDRLFPRDPDDSEDQQDLLGPLRDISREMAQSGVRSPRIVDDLRDALRPLTRREQPQTGTSWIRELITELPKEIRSGIQSVKIEAPQMVQELRQPQELAQQIRSGFQELPRDIASYLRTFATRSTQRFEPPAPIQPQQRTEPGQVRRPTGLAGEALEMARQLPRAISEFTQDLKRGTFEIARSLTGVAPRLAQDIEEGFYPLTREAPRRTSIGLSQFVEQFKESFQRTRRGLGEVPLEPIPGPPPRRYWGTYTRFWTPPEVPTQSFRRDAAIRYLDTLVEGYTAPSVLSNFPEIQRRVERKAQGLQAEVRTSGARVGHFMATAAADVAGEYMEQIIQSATGIPIQLGLQRFERPTTREGTRRPTPQPTPPVTQEAIGPRPGLRFETARVVGPTGEITPVTMGVGAGEILQRARQLPQAFDRISSAVAGATEIIKTVSDMRDRTIIGRRAYGYGGVGMPPPSGRPPTGPPPTPREPLSPQLPGGRSYAALFLREALDPLTSIMWGAMFTVAWPMQMQMLRPLVEPVQQFVGMQEAMTSFFTRGVAGFDYLSKTFQQIMQVSPLERYNMLYQTQAALTSALGAGPAQRAITSALEMARQYPLTTQEILQGIRALSVYPQAKPYIAAPEFQKMLTEVVSGLSLINPMQGVGGALFSIVEAMSGSWRSLQMRFNISPELVASMAGMTRAEMSSDPMKLIQGLHTFVTKALGTGAFEAQRYTLDKQVANLEDAIDMMTKSVFEASGVYQTLVKGAVAGQTAFGTLAAPGGIITQAFREFLRPFSQSIETAVGQFLGISPVAVSMMSPREIETLTQQTFETLSPQEIRARLGRSIGTLLTGFTGLRESVGNVFKDMFRDLGPQVLPAIQKEIVTGMTQIISGAAKGAMSLFTSPQFLMNVLPLYGGMFLGGKFLLGGLNLLQRFMAGGPAGAAEPLAAAFTTTPGWWAAQRLLRPSVAVLGGSLLGLGPSAAMIPGMARFLGPLGEMMAGSRIPLFQQIGESILPAATAFGYAPLTHRLLGQRIPEASLRPIRGFLQTALSSHLGTLLSTINNSVRQVIPELTRVPLVRGQIALPEHQLRRLSPEIQGLITSYNNMSRWLTDLREGNVTLGQALEILGTRRRSLEQDIERSIQMARKHLGIRSPIKFQGGILTGGSPEQIEQILGFRALGRPVASMIEEFGYLQGTQTAIQRQMSTMARRMLGRELLRAGAFGAAQFGAFALGAQMMPSHPILGGLLPMLAINVMEPLLAPGALGAFRGAIPRGLFGRIGTGVRRFFGGPAGLATIPLTIGAISAFQEGRYGIGGAEALTAGGLAAYQLGSILGRERLARFYAPIVRGARGFIRSPLGLGAIGTGIIAAEAIRRGETGPGLAFGAISAGLGALQIGSMIGWGTVASGLGAAAGLIASPIGLIAAGLIGGAAILRRRRTAAEEERIRAGTIEDIAKQLESVGINPAEAQNIWQAARKAAWAKKSFLSKTWDFLTGWARTSDELEIGEEARAELGRRIGGAQVLQRRIEELRKTREKFLEAGLGTVDIDKAISILEVGKQVALGRPAVAPDQQRMTRLITEANKAGQAIQETIGSLSNADPILRRRRTIEAVQNQIKQYQDLAMRSSSQADRELYQSVAQFLRGSLGLYVSGQADTFSQALTMYGDALKSSTTEIGTAIGQIHKLLAQQQEVTLKSGQKVRVLGLQAQNQLVGEFSQLIQETNNTPEILRNSITQSFGTMLSGMILSQRQVQELAQSPEFSGRRPELERTLQENRQKLADLYKQLFVRSSLAIDKGVQNTYQQMMTQIEQATGMTGEQLLQYGGGFGALAPGARATEFRQKLTQTVGSLRKELSSFMGRLQEDLGYIPEQVKETYQALKSVEGRIAAGEKISPETIQNLYDNFQKLSTMQGEIGQKFKEWSNRLAPLAQEAPKIQTGDLGGILDQVRETRGQLENILSLGVLPQEEQQKIQTITNKLSQLEGSLSKGIVPENFTQQITSIQEDLSKVFGGMSLSPLTSGQAVRQALQNRMMSLRMGADTFVRSGVIEPLVEDAKNIINSLSTRFRLGVAQIRPGEVVDTKAIDEAFTETSAGISRVMDTVLPAVRSRIDRAQALVQWGINQGLSPQTLGVAFMGLGQTLRTSTMGAIDLIDTAIASYQRAARGIPEYEAKVAPQIGALQLQREAFAENLQRAQEFPYSTVMAMGLDRQFRGPGGILRMISPQISRIAGAQLILPIGGEFLKAVQSGDWMTSIRQLQQIQQLSAMFGFSPAQQRSLITSLIRNTGMTPEAYALQISRVLTDVQRQTAMGFQAGVGGRIAIPGVPTQQPGAPGQQPQIPGQAPTQPQELPGAAARPTACPPCEGGGTRAAPCPPCEGQAPAQGVGAPTRTPTTTGAEGTTATTRERGAVAAATSTQVAPVTTGAETLSRAAQQLVPTTQKLQQAAQGLSELPSAVAQPIKEVPQAVQEGVQQQATQATGVAARTPVLPPTAQVLTQNQAIAAGFFGTPPGVAPPIPVDKVPEKLPRGALTQAGAQMWASYQEQLKAGGTGLPIAYDKATGKFIWTENLTSGVGVGATPRTTTPMIQPQRLGAAAPQGIPTPPATAMSGELAGAPIFGATARTDQGEILSGLFGGWVSPGQTYSRPDLGIFSFSVGGGRPAPGVSPLTLADLNLGGMAPTPTIPGPMPEGTFKTPGGDTSFAQILKESIGTYSPVGAQLSAPRPVISDIAQTIDQKIQSVQQAASSSVSSITQELSQSLGDIGTPQMGVLGLRDLNLIRPTRIQSGLRASLENLTNKISDSVQQAVEGFTPSLNIRAGAGVATPAPEVPPAPPAETGIPQQPMSIFAGEIQSPLTSLGEISAGSIASAATPPVHALSEVNLSVESPPVATQPIASVLSEPPISLGEAPSPPPVNVSATAEVGTMVPPDIGVFPSPSVSLSESIQMTEGQTSPPPASVLSIAELGTMVPPDIGIFPASSVALTESISSGPEGIIGFSTPAMAELLSAPPEVSSPAAPLIDIAGAPAAPSYSSLNIASSDSWGFITAAASFPVEGTSYISFPG